MPESRGRIGGAMSGAGLRRHIVAGLVVIAPVGVTLYVLWWTFELLDNLIGRFLYPVLPFPIPGLGLLALLGLLIGVGWLAERAVGGRFVAWWHDLLESLPLTRNIYGASSRIIRTVLSRDRRPFRQVVLFEYPTGGRWSIGFVAAAAPPFARDVVPDGSVTVFMPTTPNPTTGYLVTVPGESVVPVDLTVEEAFTYILSAGTVAPEATIPAAGTRTRPLEAP